MTPQIVLDMVQLITAADPTNQGMSITHIWDLAPGHQLIGLEMILSQAIHAGLLITDGHLYSRPPSS